MSQGPYVSTTASVGGLPDHVDIAIDAVFIVLFVIGAVAHMSILQINRRKQHKFLWSGPLFGFCMARIVTNIMRIVWATRQRNTKIALAATIFYYAGTVLLYIVNAFFAFRFLASVRPFTEQFKILKIVRATMLVLLMLSLIALITAVIQSSFTHDTYIHHVDRAAQLTANTYNLVYAITPIPITVWAVIIRLENEPTYLGTGRWHSKAAILGVSTALTIIIAGFRCGTFWMTPRPLNDPAWYHAKWAFYVFAFVPEILIVYLFALARIDQRFHIYDNVMNKESEKPAQGEGSSQSSMV